MRDDYSDLKRKLGRYACVSIYDPKFREYDDSLVGLRGEIWPDGDQYRAVEHFPTFDRIFPVTKQELTKVKNRLGVPFRVEEQVALAKAKRRPNG